MMALFGKPKKKAPPKASDTIVKLDDNIDLLKKKMEHLSERIAKETQVARQNASSNKRAAMTALKRRKLYEKQLSQISDTIFTLEQQRIALENVSTNVGVLQVMQEVKETMQGINQGMDVDTVDDIVIDLQEQMDLADEVATAISTPMGNSLFDDDELEAELAMLEDESIDAQLSNLDSLPAAPAYVPPGQQAAPAKKQMSAEDELAALEAEMG